jgi:hypothetical protein
MTAKPRLRTVKPHVPPAPDGLGPTALDLWHAVHADYELAPHHVAVFVRALRALDRAVTAEAAVAEHGQTFDDRFGQPRPRPEVKIAHDDGALFARLMTAIDLDAELARAAFVTRRR